VSQCVILTPARAQITYHGFSLIHFSGLVHTLPILNSCKKDRCDFLFVRYERHYCTELVSWEHAACPLSGIKKCPLVGGWLNISSVVISIGATASVRYREVVCSWEGPLLEVPLYYFCKVNLRRKSGQSNKCWISEWKVTSPEILFQSCSSYVPTTHRPSPHPLINILVVKWPY